MGKRMQWLRGNWHRLPLNENVSGCPGCSEQRRGSTDAEPRPMSKRRASAMVAIAALTIGFAGAAHGTVALYDYLDSGWMYVADSDGESTVIGSYGNVIFTSRPIGNALPNRCSAAGTSTVNGVLVYLTQCPGALSWNVYAGNEFDVLLMFSPNIGLHVEGGPDIDIIRLDSPGKALGNKENDHIFDSPGDDVIQGNAGNDSIFATAGGNDTLNGGEGADIIHAIDGKADTVNCGADGGMPDTVYVDQYLDDVVNCGPADTVLYTE